MGGEASCSATVALEHCSCPPPTVFDDYDFGDLLGSGVFGQVRRCWRRRGGRNQRHLAVKIVDTHGEIFAQAKSHISPTMEAEVLLSVRHPHIVELYDVYEQENWLFLIMEHISGGELFASFADPRLTVTEATVGAACRQLLQALEHLHLQKIIHRDVKAENVLLAEHPRLTGNWRAKLIDFGLAARLDHAECMGRPRCCVNEPLDELICGTAYYCAPEAWDGDYGPKVDVFAAGVIMYLALFGAFPFHHRDTFVLEAMICSPSSVPPFRPVCAKECPNYQVSALALDTVEALLAKDHQLRPDAGEAIRLPFLNTTLVLRGGPAANRPAASFASSHSTFGSESSPLVRQGDQLIPAPVRHKAGRAACRPPIDEAQERSRTKAFEELRWRSSRDSETWSKEWQDAGITVDLSNPLASTSHSATEDLRAV